MVHGHCDEPENSFAVGFLDRCISHGLLFVLIAALHVWAVRTLDHSVRAVTQPPQDTGALVTVLIKPGIRERGDQTSDPDLSSLVLKLDHQPIHLQIEAPDLDFSVERNDAAHDVAPSLRGDGQSGIEAYVKRAGLSPGQGATVVLRVEVLETGEAGRVIVEVSGGSRPIDEAAVEYAQAQRWYAGRVGGVPRRVWIRWAVHLQG
jgi:hypothetical protein